MTEPELSNIDVVLYALFKLGGDERKIHTEEIAYEAYSLAKERFGWRLSRFRDMGFPDKEPVRRALMDAAKKNTVILPSGGQVYTPRERKLMGGHSHPKA
jgi:hypothetical protein